MENLEQMYTTSLIAELLGVNVASIDRWVASGKLKCTLSSEGKKYFSLSDLSEFSKQYNISMKFLEKNYQSTSFAKKMIASK